MTCATIHPRKLIQLPKSKISIWAKFKTGIKPVKIVRLGWFFFQLVSEITLRKKIIFPIIKDFGTGWEKAMIFNPMADSWWFSWSLQTKQWRALCWSATRLYLGSWRCIYMYVDTLCVLFMWILCMYICIYIWVETLKSTGLQLMTRSWVVC